MDWANRSHRVFNETAAKIRTIAITRQPFRPTRKSGELFIGSSRCIYVRGLYHCLGAVGKSNFSQSESSLYQYEQRPYYVFETLDSIGRYRGSSCTPPAPPAATHARL